MAVAAAGPGVVTPEQLFYTLGRQVGNETQLFPDASASMESPVFFDIKGPSNDTFAVFRVCLLMIDNDINPTLFAGLPALTNGILIHVVDAQNQVLLDFLDGQSIKKNADWCLLAGADVIYERATPPLMEDQLMVRWSMNKMTGNRGLHLAVGQKIRFTIRDDLTGITEGRVMAQGLR